MRRHARAARAAAARARGARPSADWRLGSSERSEMCKTCAIKYMRGIIIINENTNLLLRVLTLLLILALISKLPRRSRDGAGLMAFYIPEHERRPHFLGVRGVEVEVYSRVGPGVSHYAAIPCRVSL